MPPLWHQVRWSVLALLFLVTVINFVDRFGVRSGCRFLHAVASSALQVAPGKFSVKIVVEWFPA